MSRRKARAVRWVAHAFATTIALGIIATIIMLPFALLAARFVGLSAYVVQGAPTESPMPIGSLVLVADTAWVAVPTLGYAVTYAESYAPPIAIGVMVWILSVFAVRALTPYMWTARRRLPA
jgi:hypothetical protein